LLTNKLIKVNGTETQTKRLLLVEDDPNDERLALRGLRRAGVTRNIEVARDGQEAIDAIDMENGEGFALVLLDLKLPKISGHDVLKHVRDRYPGRDLPVVVFTSSDEPSDLSRCKELGVTDYVTKPIDFEDYVLTIRRIAIAWLN
jgi:two-component system response regulator